MRDIINIPKVKGLFAAPFTPLNPDASVNLEMIPFLVESLINDGLTGAFVCGSNGEGPNLTIEERKEVAKAFVNASGGRLKIWVHVGHTSIEESRSLMKHAHEIGADAASSVAAFYFKPDSVQTLVKAMAAIASSVPEMPFYYYHIPAITGVGMDMLQFLKLAEEAIPNLHGIKYTANTLWEYQACLNHYGDRYNILFGYDEMLLPALASGAQAAIGSTYNFAAPLYLDIIRDFELGKIKEARKSMNLLIDMVREMVKFPAIPAQKAIMGMLNREVGGCRLPLTTLNEQEFVSLKQGLDRIGFWDALKNRNENH